MTRNTTNAPSTPAASRVVVVGAGLAGVTAAYRLQQRGVDVVVLEARDRVGGRLWSVTDGFAAGQHADLGGELVDGNYRLVPAMCDEFGVELTSPVSYHRDEAVPDETPLEAFLAPGRYLVDGERLEGEAFAAVDREIRAAVQAARPVAHEITEQWIRRARLSDTAAAVVRLVARMPTMLDPWESDVHYLFTTRMGDGVRRIKGGSDRLPIALAEHLDIRFGTTVTALRQNGGQVRVETASDETYVGDQAVLAVPLAVVPTLGFTPPLPDEQLTVAGEWRPAHGGKVAAQYAEGDDVRAAFLRCVYSDGPIMAAWLGDNDVVEGPAVVAGLVGGVERRILDDPDLAIATLDDLVATMIGRRPTRLAAATKNWTPDPLTLQIAVTPGAEQWQPAVARAARPHRRIHMAGDHTDDLFCSCMEGAARSGERVADEVLALAPRIHVTDIEQHLVNR